jgi:hypothetical protein
MSNLFNSKIPLKVQKRNAFSQDFTNSLTTKVGTLTPCFVKQVMPGDKIKLGVNLNVELPPMASAFKGKVSAHIEFFFVPWRIVYGGWRNYYLFNGGLATQYAPAGIPKVVLPVLNSPQKRITVAKGSLADYLGIRSFKDVDDTGLTSLSLLPFLAYHKIWEDWYRDPQVQKPAFMESSRTEEPQKVYSLPFHQCYGTNGDHRYSIDSQMFDGTLVTSLRQRNYGKDIFTNCYTTPTGGSQPLSVSTSGNKFTISQLRQANALQKFAERNQIAGGRYDEVTIANYGVKPADSALNEALYLGRLVTSVYNTSVYSQTNTNDAMGDPSTNQNPFTNSLAGRGANSSAQGGSLILKDFEAKEFGVVMGIFSLVPHATYKSGIDPIMLLGTTDAAFSDNFPIPALAGIGNEPIEAYMITGNLQNTDVFGYTDRYCWWKYSLDEVHGKLAVPQGERASLSFMQLTRNFDPESKVQQSSSFLEIPTNAMDEITAVRSSLSEYGCIVDLFYNYTTIRPLPAYSIPSLCDDIDQATIRTIERGGKYL